MYKTDKYDIFLSYRREGGSDTASHIKDSLEEKGYKVFLDIESLRAGPFNEKLYEFIQNSTDFILILPENGLDRCANPEDWVRKEVEFAKKCQKNIVPIFLTGFKFPETLPESLDFLRHQNGLAASVEYYDAFIDRLVKFLTPKKRFPVKAVAGICTLLVTTMLVLFLIPKPGPNLWKKLSSNTEVLTAFADYYHCNIGDKLPENAQDEKYALIINGDEVAFENESDSTYKFTEIDINGNVVSRERLDQIIDTINNAGIHIVSLYIDNTKIINPNSISKLKELKNLYIRNNELGDITFLNNKELKKLSAVDISYNPISDFVSLRKLEKLEKLYLRSTGLKNIDPVLIQSLTCLNIRDNKVTDISGVSELKNLTKLYIDDNYISNFDGISDKRINVVGKDKQKLPLFDIDEDTSEVCTSLYNDFGLSKDDEIYYSELPEKISIKIALKGVELSDGSKGYKYQETDLSEDMISAERLTSLVNDINVLGLKVTHLIIANTRIESIEPILKIQGLKVLLLIHCGLDDEKIQCICNLRKSLEQLNLRGNEISNIKFLEELTGLTFLNIYGNNISDISYISGLGNLENLTLSNNNIEDYSPLEKLNKIQKLYLDNTGIQDLSVLDEMKSSLKKLSVTNNTITDISNLKVFKQLNTVWLGGNCITDFLPISHVQNVYGKDTQRIPDELIEDKTNSEVYAALCRDFETTEDGQILMSKLPEKLSVKISLDGIVFSDAANDISYQEADLSEDMISEEMLSAIVNDINVLGLNVTALIIENTGIESIEPIFQVKCLEKLLLMRCGLDDEKVQGMNELKDTLKTVNLKNNEITSVTFLEGLSGLTFLRLDNNKITDINSISGLTDLTFLNLAGNSIINFLPVKKLNKLKKLYLSNTGLQDLSVLDGLKSSLEKLDISNNLITDISIMKDFKQLKTIWLGGNCITDFSSVEHIQNVYGKDDQKYLATGKCGEAVTWTIIENGGPDNALILHIDGKGDMHDYDYDNRPPWYEYKDRIYSIKIGDSVTGIGIYAFVDITIDDLFIPKSIKELGFYFRPLTKSFSVSEENENYIAIDNVLYSKDLAQLISYPRYKEGESYSVLDGTSVIDECAFYCNKNIKMVQLPDTVTDIKNYAFSGTKLVEITIPSSVKTIRKDAFTNCTSLKNITLEGPVDTIEDGAFDESVNIIKAYE